MTHNESFQLNAFRSYVAVLGDVKATDDKKLRAAQELSEHFEIVVQSSSYPSFLEHSLKAFMHFLQDGEPQFIQEYQAHQVRKLILEMIHRLPISENLRQHVKSIIALMLKILQIDNEENVLVCLRVIIELHKNFRPSIMSHASSVTSGILSLMQLCPKEAAHLRKELLIAARHIFATDLRQKFIPSIERLFDEDLLIGKGVTLESIRPLAYSTLADLAHHVRQSLSLKVLEVSIKTYSKNVHDETLATGIQTMSCKLLLNLVDCVRQHSELEPFKARNLLTTLLKVFVYKFQSIATIILPSLIQKLKAPSSTSGATISTTNTVDNSKDTETTSVITISSTETSPSKFPTSSFVNGNQMISNLNNVVEYRSLVKTLVGGIKTITWGFVSSKSPFVDASKMKQDKLFQPEEISIYIDLVYWAMEALDIYAINTSPTNLSKTSGVLPRTKEEKEVLEHFSGIFLMMHSQNFQEIFATSIEFMVERIHKNPSLQIVANSFLANPVTSPLFATVLVEYLLGKMHEMGTNVERSNLYLRLFKLVFGSVSLFPIENEQMLRPHLHNIVNQSMELALTAEEPYNYFLLLRALFRSIGGGSHDLLYQEFLPLLPNLLEGLNRLQSGYHKQHMKDLFVELCLTVPVRLSSLLPYLPMLMDPLVSALNGSNTLVSQVGQIPV